jgi:hypothetical protein
LCPRHEQKFVQNTHSFADCWRHQWQPRVNLHHVSRTFRVVCRQLFILMFKVLVAVSQVLLFSLQNRVSFRKLFLVLRKLFLVLRKLFLVLGKLFLELFDEFCLQAQVTQKLLLNLCSSFCICLWSKYKLKIKHNPHFLQRNLQSLKQ